MSFLSGVIVLMSGCCMGAWLTMGVVFWVWMELSIKLDEAKQGGEDADTIRNRF